MRYSDETVMAASERLMELAEQQDDRIAAQEREDRLWEMGGWSATPSPSAESGDSFNAPTSSPRATNDSPDQKATTDEPS